MATATGSRRHGAAAPWVAAAGLLAVFGALSGWVGSRHWAPVGPDSPVVDWVVTHRPASWAAAARALTWSGTGVFPYAAAVGAGLLAGGAAALRGRWAALCRVAVCCAVLGLGQVVRRLLMTAFGRPRPPAADWGGVVAHGQAFPSGHATTTAMAAALLAFGLHRLARRRGAGWWPAAAAVCALWAAAVGATRVYLAVHWTTDVLAGWALGAAWSALALGVLRWWTARRPPAGAEARVTSG